MTDKIVTVQAATISGSEPTQTPVNADVSTINVTATVQDTSVTGDVESASIDVQVSGMGEESLPNDTLFKRNQEYTNIQDTFKARYGKLFIELVSKSDIVSLLVNYKRTFIENKTVTEVKSFAIGKKVVEVASLQETARKRVDKVFSDLFSKADENAKRVGKNVIESQLVSELVKLTAGKNVEDIADVQDEFARQINFFRIFVDTVDATDDFLGEANVDDDQTARVGKNVIDYVAPSEVSTKKFTANKFETTTATEQKRAQTTKVLLDSKALSDIINLAYGKIANEQVNNTDLFLVNLGKSVVEYTSAPDTVYKSIAKNYVDTITKADTNSKNIGKNTSDVADAQDVNYLRFVKILSELVSSADTVSQLIKPSKVDQVTQSDQQYSLIGKNVIETQVTSDIFSRVVNYSRIFTDLVDATDDFLGNANIDDDQVARVGKNVIEYVGFQETTSFAASKSLLDTFTKSDIFAKNVGKYTADTLSGTLDTASKNAQKVANETVSPNDGFIRLVNYNRAPAEIVLSTESIANTPKKVLVDILSSTDLFARLVNYYRTFADTSTTSEIKYFRVEKVLADSTAGTTDVATKAPNKGVTETVNSIDVLSRTVDYKRTYTDAVDATDDFLGAANVDDDQTARVGKVVVDTTTTSDTPVFNAGRILADSATAQETSYKRTTKQVTDQFTKSDVISRNSGKRVVESVISSDVFSFNKTTNSPLLDSFSAIDSGSINIQSYFAGTFATPGYVGTNTSFT